jgi:hypothetical protein
LHPYGTGSSRNLPQCGLDALGVGRIEKHGNMNGLGHHLMQERQTLGRYLRAEKIVASRVATWPGKAGDKSSPDRVFTDPEDDRDSRCSSFGRDRRGPADRSDHGHTTADQVSHQRRQAIVMALQPVVLDRHVLALDVAGFTEPPPERGHKARHRIDRPGA